MSKKSLTGDAPALATAIARMARCNRGVGTHLRGEGKERER